MDAIRTSNVGNSSGNHTAYVSPFVIVLHRSIQICRPPVVDAGDDERASSEERIELSGAGTYDPEDDKIRYSWNQVLGLKVELTRPYSEVTSFRAPRVNDMTLLEFELTAKDYKSSSLPDPVEVIVRP